MLSYLFLISVTMLNFYFWKESIFVLSGVCFLFFMKMGYMINLNYVDLQLCLDSFSYPLIMLSFWLVSLCLLSSLYIRNNQMNKGIFLIFMVMLVLSLFLTFTFNSLILFYIGFEFCLIPVFFLILGFGSQPERMEAGVYMFFYTLLGSLPLLIIILYIISTSGGSFFFLPNGQLYSESQFFFFFLVFGFLIKFPIYAGHLWLLKAHVEAPVAGSMILAGVLLKLGGYGMIRVLGFMAMSNMGFKEFFMVLSLMGAVFISVGCLRHFDMKLLVASSSVVHMSFCIVCIFIMSDLSYKGTMITMIAHGLCSSGLFFGVNSMYDRLSSRSLLFNKGTMSFLPSFALWWFMLLIGNMAAPPTINLLGELNMILCMVYWEMSLVIFIMMVSFFSALYSLYLFSLSSHGKYILNKSSYKPSLITDHIIFFLHILPVNALILCSFLIY